MGGFFSGRQMGIHVSSGSEKKTKQLTEIKGKTNIITDELTHGCQQRSTQIFHREQRVQIPLPHLRHVQHKADTTVETDIS